MRNIALIGMMGTYKSSVGLILARQLGMFFLDCDKLLEHELAMSISEMFAQYGEGYFREQESKMIRTVSTYANVVISTGGGVVLNQSNMHSLKQNCLVIGLTAGAGTIFNRIKDSDCRPLLAPVTKYKIHKLLTQRTPEYERWADFTVDTTRLTSQQSAQKVLLQLRDYQAEWTD